MATYITDDSVRFARGSDFVGTHLSAGATTSFAWVRARSTSLRARPNAP